MQIQIDKLTVIVNKDQLLKEISEITTDPDMRCDDSGSIKDYQITVGKKLAEKKLELTNFVSHLTPETLVEVFNRSVHVTKKGALAKNRKHTAYDNRIITQYSNMYSN